MLKINSSGRFKKDLKICQKRGYDLRLLETVIDILRIPDQLPIHNKDHFLKGIIRDVESVTLHRTCC